MGFALIGARSSQVPLDTIWTRQLCNLLENNKTSRVRIPLSPLLSCPGHVVPIAGQVWFDLAD